MARRTLFFSAQQVFWECRTKRASLHQYSQLLNEMNLKANKESVFNKIPRMPRHPFEPTHGKHADYRCWHDTLEVYSQKSLTHSSDKLPALAGLAQIFASADDIYLAGT